MDIQVSAGTLDSRDSARTRASAVLVDIQDIRVRLLNRVGTADIPDHLDIQGFLLPPRERQGFQGSVERTPDLRVTRDFVD